MTQPTTWAGWVWLLATAILLPGAVAWMTARVQSAELRRQFDVKASVDRTNAATTLLHQLDEFYRRCEDRFELASKWLASSGTTGSVPIVGDLRLPVEIDSAAAQLGPDVASVAASLRSTFGRSVDVENAGAAAGLDLVDFAQVERKSLATLVLQSRELVRQATKAARMTYALNEQVDDESLRAAANSRSTNRK